MFTASRAIVTLWNAIASIAVQSGAAVRCLLALTQFHADSFVILHFTFFASIAGVARSTGIDANSVDTGPFQRTFVTMSTSEFFAADKLGPIAHTLPFDATDRTTVGVGVFLGT